MKADGFMLKFEKGESDLWFVSSVNEPGLFVCHQSLDAIISDLPNILNLWLKRKP